MLNSSPKGPFLPIFSPGVLNSCKFDYSSKYKLKRFTQLATFALSSQNNGKTTFRKIDLFPLEQIRV